MKKCFSSTVLLGILFLQVALAIIPSVGVVSAAGNVTSSNNSTGNLTINDFTCSITHGTVPMETRLTANVTGKVTKWKWEFYNPQIDHWSYSGGNGNDVTTSHEFGRAKAYGVFNVTLIVVGPNGSDSLKKIDYVVGNRNTTGLPTANFSASSTSGYAPLNVTFTDKSKNASTALWYFGLTNTSKEKNPTYTFKNPGTYRVVLEVSNGRGWDATAQEITVLGQQKVIPEAGFDADTSNGLDVQLVDTSQNATGWNWNFGDGTNSTDQNPEHTYSSAGNYTVNLTASNENGTVSVNKTIDVEETSSSSDDSSSSDSSSSDDSSSSSGSSVGTASIVSSSGSSSGSSSSSSSASVITVANESNDSTVNTSTNSTNVSASPENQSNVTVNETQSNNTQGLEQNNSTAATEQTSEQTPSANNSSANSGNGDKKSPGFESAFGIVGLLAAVFLYKRK